MKKFVIRNADGSAQDVMPALHSSRQEALLTILDYGTTVVGDDKDDSLAEIPANYIVEVIEGKDVNEQITDFESAKKVIGPAEFILAKESLRFSDIEINMKHTGALIALNKLFTIAQAWNKEDGFVPDFSNLEQDKWFPWFKYDKDTAGFVFTSAHYSSSHATAYFGARLCFKTPKRAAQFGRQFISLYNEVFL